MHLCLSIAPGSGRGVRRFFFMSEYSRAPSPRLCRVYIHYSECGCRNIGRGVVSDNYHTLRDDTFGYKAGSLLPFSVNHNYYYDECFLYCKLDSGLYRRHPRLRVSLYSQWLQHPGCSRLGSMSLVFPRPLFTSRRPDAHPVWTNCKSSSFPNELVLFVLLPATIVGTVLPSAFASFVYYPRPHHYLSLDGPGSGPSTIHYW